MNTSANANGRDHDPGLLVQAVTPGAGLAALEDVADLAKRIDNSPTRSRGSEMKKDVVYLIAPL